MQTEKLYVVVRADLSPGMQLAQAVHAALLFAHTYPAAERRWYELSNNVVICQLAHEAAVVGLFEAAHRAGHDAVAFTEPDLGDEVTAVALGPAAKRLTARLPLAGAPAASLQP